MLQDSERTEMLVAQNLPAFYEMLKTSRKGVFSFQVSSTMAEIPTKLSIDFENGTISQISGPQDLQCNIYEVIAEVCPEFVFKLDSLS